MFSESVHLPSSRQDGVRTLRWTCAYVGLEEGAGPPPPPDPGPMPSQGDVAAPGGHEGGRLLPQSRLCARQVAVVTASEDCGCKWML